MTITWEDAFQYRLYIGRGTAKADDSPGVQGEVIPTEDVRNQVSDLIGAFDDALTEADIGSFATPVVERAGTGRTSAWKTEPALCYEILLEPKKGLTLEGIFEAKVSTLARVLKQSEVWAAKALVGLHKFPKGAAEQGSPVSVSDPV